MRHKKWVFHPILASAGFVLPVAVMNVASAEPSADANAPKSEAVAPAPAPTDASPQTGATPAPKMDEAQSDAAAAASDPSEGAAASAAGDATETPDVSSAPSPAAATVEYVVQPGDTLGDIAREHLGSVEGWRRIAELNGIDDPTTLAVGTHLALPVN